MLLSSSSARLASVGSSPWNSPDLGSGYGPRSFPAPDPEVLPPLEPITTYRPDASEKDFLVTTYRPDIAERMRPFFDRPIRLLESLAISTNHLWQQSTPP